MIVRRLNFMLGGTIVLLMGVVALVGAFWTPYDPLAIDFVVRLQPPSWSHAFGTDQYGRDVLSRAMSGAKSTGWIVALTITMAFSLGTLLGVLSGYLGGWTDRIISTISNAFLAFPSILFAFSVIAVAGASPMGVVLALGLAYSPAIARVVRGTVLSLREKEFVDASRVCGNSHAYTMLRHIVPNTIAPMIVLATSAMGWTILAEGGLSFLGLGIPPPSPSWGNMLADARPFLQKAEWLAVFPGFCIMVTLLGLNLSGDALRDILDPRMRGI
jgi:peptide/nickel transport system permease protein